MDVNEDVIFLVERVASEFIASRARSYRDLCPILMR